MSKTLILSALKSLVPVLRMPYYDFIIVINYIVLTILKRRCKWLMGGLCNEKNNEVSNIRYFDSAIIGDLCRECDGRTERNRHDPEAIYENTNDFKKYNEPSKSEK